jgi:hypothetical protein
MYTFRGFNLTRKEWIFGNGVEIMSNAAQIHDKKEPATWAFVDPETVGIEHILTDCKHTKVYQGDILRYSFEHKGEFYNRYYCIKENSLEVWAEELWRDYELDCETFETERFHNTKYKGTRRDITTFNTVKAWKVVGNIWQNPELL